jgi:hypothetical protein
VPPRAKVGPEGVAGCHPSSMRVANDSSPRQRACSVDGCPPDKGEADDRWDPRVRKRALNERFRFAAPNLPVGTRPGPPERGTPKNNGSRIPAKFSGPVPTLAANPTGPDALNRGTVAGRFRVRFSLSLGSLPA